jgi:NAD(P)-dependent dehydrogenase (short-subunit alcohol dehydrogenase family)
MIEITLKGKVALVTGGGAGIGRAIVKEYAGLGAAIAVAEIDPAKCEALRRAMPEALVVEADVQRADHVSALRDAIEQRFGRLDVLVNNVGHFLGIRKPLEVQTEDEWDAIYNINLRHMFLVCRAMIPLMKRGDKGGSIINLSSIEGFRGCPYNVVYTTMKHAVTGLTRGLAIELSGDGIRVNCIAPETTDTEQVPLERAFTPEMRRIADGTIPLGRLGRVEDHAGAAVFLATDLSQWVSGSCLIIDGGGLVGNVFQRTPEGRWTNMPIVTGDTSQRPTMAERGTGVEAA